jgi:RNA polymerase sigma factor (sigma-70 family)
MAELDDIELLREYALNNSDAAFAVLVSRHINLVYSTALRAVRNHHQAQEITQAVFVILARKARSLGSKTILSGWLFRTARFTAANYLKTEMRRVRREQEVYMQANSADNVDDIWQQVDPVLNDAIADLGEKDRSAIVLRFLEAKGYKEVAAALGASEEAAQMWVSRALEKLRTFFAKRGVTVTTSALGGMMTTHGTQAAPNGLATSIAVATAKGAAVTSSASTLVTTTLKIMAWSKIKTAVVIGAAAILAIGTATTFVANHSSGRAAGNGTGLLGKLGKKSAIMKQMDLMRGVSPAIFAFAAAHNDELPKTFAELGQYLPPDLSMVDDAHWQILATGKMARLMEQPDLSSVILVQEKTCQLAAPKSSCSPMEAFATNSLRQPQGEAVGKFSKRAFTLTEMLVVIAVIAILAAILLPVLSASKAKSQRTVCLNNLHRIDFGMRMYLDDQRNRSPGNTNTAGLPFLSWTDYRPLIGNYVEIKGAPAPEDKIFSCPADTFFYVRSRNGSRYMAEPMHAQADHAFTSYAFNAGQFTAPSKTNAATTITNYYGIAGQRLETVTHPSRTVLLAEAPAFSPYSWHEPMRPFSKENALFVNAKDFICFVDGHVDYVKMYFDGKTIAWAYNPPAGYEYQWSGN